LSEAPRARHLASKGPRSAPRGPPRLLLHQSTGVCQHEMPALRLSASDCASVSVCQRQTVCVPWRAPLGLLLQGCMTLISSRRPPTCPLPLLQVHPRKLPRPPFVAESVPGSFTALNDAPLARCSTLSAQLIPQLTLEGSFEKPWKCA